jgi:hypothetical protein
VQLKCDPLRDRGNISSDHNTKPQGIMIGFFKEMSRYMIARKKWWLLPSLLVLLIMGGFLALAQVSAVSPFIYTMF